MDLTTLGAVFTACVFGGFGWWRARKLRQRAGAPTFVLLSVLALIGCGMGVGSRLLDVFGFAVPLGLAISASCVGACVGLVVRNRELGRQAAG